MIIATHLFIKYLLKGSHRNFFIIPSFILLSGSQALASWHVQDGTVSTTVLQDGTIVLLKEELVRFIQATLGWGGGRGGEIPGPVQDSVTHPAHSGL